MSFICQCVKCVYDSKREREGESKGEMIGEHSAIQTHVANTKTQ